MPRTRKWCSKPLHVCIPVSYDVESLGGSHRPRTSFFNEFGGRMLSISGIYLSLASAGGSQRPFSFDRHREHALMLALLGAGIPRQLPARRMTVPAFVRSVR